NTVSAGGVMNLPANKTSAPAAQPQPAGKEQPFNCADIKKYGIDKQMNIHAQQIMAACSGMPQPPKDASNLNLNTLNSLAKSYPAVLGGTDVNVGSPDGVYPHVTQSES